MENRLSYILVGLFLFVLLIGGVVSILWLGNYSEKGNFKFYKIATKESVSGLNDKAPSNLKAFKSERFAASLLTIKMPKKSWSRFVFKKTFPSKKTPTH